MDNTGKIDNETDLNLFVSCIKETVFKLLLWLLALTLLACALLLASRALAAPDFLSSTLYPGESERYSWRYLDSIFFGRITVLYCNAVGCIVSVYQETSGEYWEYAISGTRQEITSEPRMVFKPQLGAVYVSSSTKNEIQELFIPMELGRSIP